MRNAVFLPVKLLRAAVYHHNAGAPLLQQGRQERGREVDQAGVALRPQQLRRQNINVGSFSLN